jgi:hypothetical protein
MGWRWGIVDHRWFGWVCCGIGPAGWFSSWGFLWGSPGRCRLCGFLTGSIFRLVLLVLGLPPSKWCTCHLNCNCSNSECLNLPGIWQCPGTWAGCRNQRISIKLLVGVISTKFGYFTCYNWPFTLTYWVFCNIDSSRIVLAFRSAFYFFE